ncbi:cathepsin L1-like [Podarcis lilfordi]|uniref:Cathepsin L1-like n=1 Tax=Podarcis lilfordi TaxID=74358 RepID=A0AA35PRY9_9SAUR|nr:cathepsin L1-like [Podarcis lilfordi]
MHLISLVALTGLVLLRTFAAASDPALDQAWRDWKMTHNKVYRERNSENHRRTIWEENFRMIEKHNREASRGKHSYRMAMNHLGDLTKAEFMERLNGLSPELPRERGRRTTLFQKSDNPSLPSSVDWRSKGYVTPVKDQGSCGSCWAFSATGALEGYLARTTGRLVSLSEQNLVDCSWKQGNQGCNGGWPSWAFQYVMDNHGLDSEQSYPYVGQDLACTYKSADLAVRINGYVDIPSNDEAALQEAVATYGPVTVALDASDFHFYSSGVFDYPNCGTSLNHAVLAVGYGTQNGTPYWIIKNSWGPEWGEGGYILLKRGSNQCGVAEVASYPV